MSIRVGDTPVPIPNTTVKPYAADGTLLETARKNRRMPERVGNNEQCCFEQKALPACKQEHDAKKQ